MLIIYFIVLYAREQFEQFYGTSYVVTPSSDQQLKSSKNRTELLHVNVINFPNNVNNLEQHLISDMETLVTKRVSYCTMLAEEVNRQEVINIWSLILLAAICSRQTLVS